ncbi:asparagine synthase (glutamine-hydrolyzing) [Pseudomonas yamanorum]
MCRIFGYLTSSNNSLQYRMQSVSEAQKHGGPDAQSYVSFPNCGIGANRLAITDPSGGRQPYASIQNIYVCLNGEIYNHDDLRRELEHKGYRFNDQCDGSILPAMYVEYGPSFVEYLDGMFSIAVLDKRSDKPLLILATDCVGMKPVYYGRSPGGDSVVFSTELLALLRFGLNPARIRHDLVNQYMTVRAISDGQTFIENVSSIPPSTIVSQRQGEPLRTMRYQSRIVYGESIPKSLPEAGQALKELLAWEVNRLKIADANVCSVNSGGLDSSLITILANHRSPQPLPSFHVSCKGNWPFDERSYARDVARISGGHHYDAVLDPDRIPDLLPQMVYHLGQPNAAPHALSAFCLFQEVGNRGYRVALTGEGADELFCGYTRMVKSISHEGSDWPTTYLDGMAPCSRETRASLFKADFLRSLSDHNEKIDREFTDELLSFTGTREKAVKTFEQNRNLCHYVLHRAEPLAMASGVEVRIPFCQPRVVDFARRLEDNINLRNAARGKAVVYEAAKGILPISVMDRPKQPFTLPITSLMHKGSRLYDFVNEAVKTKRMREDTPFDTERLSSLLTEQGSNPSRNASFALWAATVYSVWIDQVSAI